MERRWTGGWGRRRSRQPTNYSTYKPTDLPTSQLTLPVVLCCRAEEEIFDPEALERRRRKEAEQWRLQQLASGMAEENPNLQVRNGETAVLCCACAVLCYVLLC